MWKRENLLERYFLVLRKESESDGEKVGVPPEDGPPQRKNKKRRKEG
jgi:hypothetical protein